MEENYATNVSFEETKFCKECGQVIAKKAVICPYCGCQVEEIASAPQQVIVTTTQQAPTHNSFSNNTLMKNKWISLFLCLFFGYIGAHKFYEGKHLMGIIYALTGGLFGIGWFFNTISLLGKPNPYYVR